jgi:hypothetical protein
MRTICLFVLLLTGCSLNQPMVLPKDAAVFEVGDPIPELIPRWHFSGRYKTCDSPLWHGCYSNNVLLVAFRPNSTESQKRSALQSVHGEIVGAVEGMYLIRIPVRNLWRDVFDAADRLGRLEVVAFAAPDFELAGMQP